MPITIETTAAYFGFTRVHPGIFPYLSVQLPQLKIIRQKKKELVMKNNVTLSFTMELSFEK